jgi:subtilisin family serine protease
VAKRSPIRKLATGAGILGVAALLLALAAGTASAAAAPAEDPLSPRLSHLATPALRSAPSGQQARALSLAPTGPGSLMRLDGRVVVEVGFDEGAANGVEALRAAGGEVLDLSRRYQVATVAVRPPELHAIAQVAGVRSVKEALAPITHGTGFACPSGLAVSEGDRQLRAAEARQAAGVDGTGVRVGILSDSFDKAKKSADGSHLISTHAGRDIQSGDLPGIGNPCGNTSPVKVLEDFTPAVQGEEAADEGRAMTQIVHDLAPGSDLAFATAFFRSQFPFAENIKRLAKPVSQGGAGANVIADDVAYFDEPFFQDGPVAAAINDVTAKGVAYFTAAGNDNLIEEPEPGIRNDIASWEAPAFRGSLACPLALTALTAATGSSDCMDFDPASGPTHVDNGFGLKVEEGGTLTVDLQWAEPWFGVETDLNVYLLNSAGVPLTEEIGGTSYLVGSGEQNIATEEPFEFFQWTNPGPAQEVQLAIERCAEACNEQASATATPRLKFLLLENGENAVSESEYPVSSGGDTVGPTIYGHASTASAITVGAVPFFSSSEPEEYSSRGPVKHYFAPVTGRAPAAPLGQPEEVEKPDLAATDCGATTFFAGFFRFFESEPQEWHFCGTSAAAPHAAAVAALMLQRDPELSPEEVRSKLMASARPVGSFGAYSVGGGLIDALGALEATPWRFGSQTVSEPPLLEVPTTETRSPYSPPPSLSSPPSPPASEAPNTRIRKHPRKVVGTRGHGARVLFAFASDQRGASFLCRLDRGRWHRCQRRLAHRFGLGRHVVKARARSAAGLVDRSPAIFRFSVRRR